MTKSIMVVDDDVDILTILTFVFENRGYRVRKARDAEEALQMVARFVPDLFILDISLPGIDGIELCRRLRAQARTRAVPIIFVTARDQPESIVQGFEAGGDDYVVKPFNMQELVARVENLFRRVREVAPAREEREGRVIAITGARGGIGKTTLAVNLALCLTRMWADEVVLVDASLEFGRAAVLLDIQNARDMQALLQETSDVLERDYLDETYLSTHPSGLRFLASPLSPADVDTVGPEEMERLVRILRPLYGYIVFDLAPSLREPYRTVLRLADRVIVVVTPEVAALVATQSLLQALSMMDVPSESILVILNNFPAAPNSPERKEIETFLGFPLASIIPGDPIRVPSAANAGRPPILEPEESDFSQAIIETTYYLSTSLRRTS